MDESSKPKDTFGRMFFRFAKFCLSAVALLYFFATIVIIEILRNPIWHAHLVQFLRRTWLRFVAEKIGSTSPGFINSILLAVAIFVIGAIGYGWMRGVAAMREHIMETVAGGIVVLATSLLLVYGSEFSWEVAKSGYADHQALAAKANAPKVSCPICPTCPTVSTFVEPKNSLRRKTLRLVEDLSAFWGKRGALPPQPIANPTSDEEKKRNAAWDQYWREAKVAYANEGFNSRLLGIVRAYKNKGIETGYLENAFEQPDRLVGSYIFDGPQANSCYQFNSEICLVRELAYHVDDHDEPIFLTSEGK